MSLSEYIALAQQELCEGGGKSKPQSARKKQNCTGTSGGTSGRDRVVAPGPSSHSRVPQGRDAAKHGEVRNALDRSAPKVVSRGKKQDPEKRDCQKTAKRPSRVKRAVLEGRQKSAASSKPVADRDTAASSTAREPEALRNWARRCQLLPPQNVHSVQSYCTQAVTVDVDSAARGLLAELFRLQSRDRSRADGVRARRRFVTGLREVANGVAAQTIKALVVAPDAEDGACATVERTVQQATAGGIPVTFALGRRELARAVGLHGHRNRSLVTMVGIYSWDGLQNEMRKLLNAVNEAPREEKKAAADPHDVHAGDLPRCAGPG
mmetsp:Transcript_12665/g.38801  ORF Transcript_12665/g.38801 Transcript_12665/m.38801 type:complete len:322 (+) Transcript_12665:360-1325(+)